MTGGELSFTAIELFRALRLRGVRDSLQVALSSRQDREFDSLYKIDTAGFDWKERGAGKPYRGVRVQPFSKLLSLLDLGERSGFVDFGAGKGRAMILAAQHGFKSITGVEISKRLSEIAQSNISRVKPVWPTVNWRCIHADAISYRPKPTDTVFFMYDSFSTDHEAKCLTRIRESQRESPRPVFWIYHNNFVRDLSAVAGIEHWKVQRHVVEGNYFFVSMLL